MHRFKHRLLEWTKRRPHHHDRLRVGEVRRHARRLYASVVGDWERKRPVWLLFLLYQLSESTALSAAEHTAPMLDVFLAQKAQDAGKRLHSIETPAEQCDPLVSLDAERLHFAINYTLAYLEWSEGRMTNNGNIGGGDAATSPLSSSVMLRRNVDAWRFANSTLSSGLVELIEHYKCGSLETSVFNAKRFVHNHGFSVSPEADARAREVCLVKIEGVAE